MLKFNMLVRSTFVPWHSDFDVFIKIFLISLAFFVMPQIFVSFRDDCTSSRCLFTTINRPLIEGSLSNVALERSVLRL